MLLFLKEISQFAITVVRMTLNLLGIAVQVSDLGVPTYSATLQTWKYPSFAVNSSPSHLFTVLCSEFCHSVSLSKLAPWSLQGSVCRNKLASFVMEGAQGSSNVAKHNKRKSPVQRWRPVSTEAVPQKGLCVRPVRIMHDCCTLTQYHHNSQCIQVFNFPWNRTPKT
jgi:hypothetical protein